MDKYIKIKFSNAKLFPKNVRSKDRVANISTTTKGKLIFTNDSRVGQLVTSFREPITIHQVSNMLHTLVGERPVPSFRKTFYESDESIFDIAGRSLIRIDSPTQKFKKSGVDVVSFINEFTKLGKGFHNSNVVRSNTQWFKVRKFLDNKFDKFIIDINKVVGYDVLTEPFESLFNSYSKFSHVSGMNILIDGLNKDKNKPISDFIKGDIASNGLISRRLGEKVVSGVDVVHFLNGEILVPYDSVFVDRLVKSTTNILDGGFVEIMGVLYEDEIGDVSGFRLLSSISDEKY